MNDIIYHEDMWDLAVRKSQKHHKTYWDKYLFTVITVIVYVINSLANLPEITEINSSNILLNTNSMPELTLSNVNKLNDNWSEEFIAISSDIKQSMSNKVRIYDNLVIRKRLIR